MSSDHIPDLTKMISDTPRTDAELEFDPTSVDEVLDWSRQLERELNASNERIKRLEEAGDALCAAAAFMGWHMEIEKWRKAKEAKP
jgi:predicted  nucleic acid-binding Zn-ribbon protein